MGLLNLFNKKRENPVFTVLINGRNFLLNMNGKKEKHGFFLQVCVEADNPNSAELEAIRLLKSDSDLNHLALNPKEDSPVVFAEKIDRVKRTKHINSMIGSRPGIAWYSEEGPNETKE